MAAPLRYSGVRTVTEVMDRQTRRNVPLPEPRITMNLITENGQIAGGSPVPHAGAPPDRGHRSRPVAGCAMIRASLRRGLPYRWWATDTAVLVLTTVLLTAAIVALTGAWVRWWG